MKNYEEIIDALKAGETLINKEEVKLKLKNGALYNIGYEMVDNWRFDYPEEWQIYIKPKWYENIPEGDVLCRHLSSPTVLIINDYNAETGQCVNLGGFLYMADDLTRLTKAEIQIFMNNAPR